MYVHKNRLTILWALFIAVLSFFPGSSFPKTHITGIDLIVHFTFYCVLTFLFITGNGQQNKFLFLKLSPIKWAMMISITYGGLIEVIQGTEFVSRSAELADFIANSIGSLIGLVLYLIINGAFKNRMPWNRKNRPVKITEKNHRNSSSSD